MAIVSFKCPNCDGELKFNPSGQNYKCEFCGSLFSQAELEEMKVATATEQVNSNAEAKADSVEVDGVTVTAQGGSDGSFVDEDGNGIDDRFESYSHYYEGKDAEDAVIYTCPSCGAEVVTDATTAATFCYYCHNPVVLGGRLEGEFLPKHIIPFQLDKKEAINRFSQYISSKRYVPKGFFSAENVEKMTGVYFPYWLYQVELNGKTTAKAKDTRSWIVGNEEYTEIKNYDCCREGRVSFFNRLQQALRKANADLVTGVLPFDLTAVVPFHMGLLSGFFAEKRDIETKEIENEIRQEMRRNAENAFRGSIKHGSVQLLSSDFRAVREDWEYLLLPVWTMTYKDSKGEIFYFSVNGQTGKSYGKLPVDYKKLVREAVLAGLVVLAFVAVVAFFAIKGGL